MLFIYPMWDHENQRIGKQKCTPLGYALHSIAEFLGFIGLLLLISISVYLGYKGISSTFRASLLWFLAIPFGLGLIGESLYQISWVLAGRRGYQYDYETCEASWIKDGKRVSYKWMPNNSDTAES